MQEEVENRTLTLVVSGTKFTGRLMKAAICPVLFLPTFLKDEIPQEHKDGLDMARDYLRRSHVLVVCGHGIDETVKSDIATAERLRITATTLDGILTVKGQGRGKGGTRHA